MTADIRRLTDACSQAIVYCQQIVAGAKLAATLQIPCDVLQETLKEIKTQGCHVRVSQVDDWAYIWIYKYPFVELLLDEVEKRGAPKSAFDTWVNGKLFGYSDYEIGCAIEEEGHIESATA